MSMTCWGVAPGVRSTCLKWRPARRGWSISISRETGLKWIAPSAGEPEAWGIEHPYFQPAGRTTEGSTVIFDASLPLGNRVMRFHSSTASWLEVFGSLVDPSVGARYSRLMSSVVAFGGTSTWKAYISTRSRRQVTGLPLAVNLTPDRSVMGPMGLW